MIGSQVFNKFIIHAEPMLVSYSLDAVARVALGHADPQSLEASMERIGGSDANIVLAKPVQMGRRAMGVFQFFAHVLVLIMFWNFYSSHLRIETPLGDDPHAARRGSC